MKVVLRRRSCLIKLTMSVDGCGSEGVGFRTSATAMAGGFALSGRLSLREFLQILAGTSKSHLDGEPIRICWSKVKGRCDLTT